MQITIAQAKSLFTLWDRTDDKCTFNEMLDDVGHGIGMGDTVFIMRDGIFFGIEPDGHIHS